MSGGVDVKTELGRLLYVAVASLINTTGQVEFPVAEDGPAVLKVLADLADQMEAAGAMPKGDA